MRRTNQENVSTNLGFWTTGSEGYSSHSLTAMTMDSPKKPKAKIPSSIINLSRESYKFKTIETFSI